MMLVSDKCPKCGEPYLFKEQWEKAGALYVHGHRKEGTLMVKQACHVPASVERGRLSVAKCRESHRSEGSQVADHHEAHFVIDSLLGPYTGYTTGEKWNGWATPHFTYEVALQIAEDSIGLSEGHRAWYDPEADAFFFYDPANEVEEAFVVTTIIVDGLQIKVYPIGSHAWTWRIRN